MQNLNVRFRNQNSATNVLSFPSDNLGSQRTGVSGDIVVCSVVVQTEAQEQNKAADAHWAHIIIHGVLHLCGYDHTTDAVATDMESLEVLILRQLGFPDPYQLR
jgi:probable rRNA maturation factor